MAIDATPFHGGVELGKAGNRHVSMNGAPSAMADAAQSLADGNL
jgi:hypothetical protein